MRAALARLTEEVRELHAPATVARLKASDVLASDRFRREFVARNIPVVITGAEPSRWAALSDWAEDDHLCRVAGNELITVDVTPNGEGDAVLRTDRCDVFVKPMEVKLTLSEFLAARRDRHCVSDRIPPSSVLYCSHQNSSLAQELPALMREVDEELPWATAAFDCPPEAVNFWMGDADSRTSMHRDHYENVYTVVTGAKHFVLLPPTEQPWLDEKPVRAARYCRSPPSPRPSSAAAAVHTLNGFDVLLDEPEELVAWVHVDPEQCEQIDGHHFSQFPPLHVTILPGEVLYLPAMWFHQVSSDDRTIAVNWWHDMDFQGPVYPLLKFLEAAAALARERDDADAGTDADPTREQAQR